MLKRSYIVNQNTNIVETDLILKDRSIQLSQLVLTLESAMKSSNIEVKRSALNVICRVCRYAGFSFCKISNKIIMIIEETKDIPVEWQWKVFYQINETIGIGSTLYTRFGDFVQILKKNLQDNSVSDDLVLLINSLLKTSLPLLKSSYILDLQLVVCAKALSFQPLVCILKLLNVLLKFNHDEIPIPLQIAKSVFNRHFSHSQLNFIAEIERGKILTSIYSHPKLPMFLTKFILNDIVFSTGEPPIKNLNLTDDESDLLSFKKNNDIENKKKVSKVSEKQILDDIKATEEIDDSVEILSVNQMLSFFNPE